MSWVNTLDFRIVREVEEWQRAFRELMMNSAYLRNGKGTNLIIS
jgi:hypothetical protein